MTGETRFVIAFAVVGGLVGLFIQGNMLSRPVSVITGAIAGGIIGVFVMMLYQALNVDNRD